MSNRIVIEASGEIFKETVRRERVPSQNLVLPESVKMLYAAKPGSFLFSLAEGWGYLRLFRKINVISSWYIKDRDPGQNQPQVFVPDVFHPQNNGNGLQLSDPFPYSLPEDWVFAFFGFYSTVTHNWNMGLGAVHIHKDGDHSLPMQQSLLPNVYENGSLCFGDVELSDGSNHYEVRLNQTIESWVAGRWNTDLLPVNKRQFMERWFMFDENHNHVPDSSLADQTFQSLTEPLTAAYPFPQYAECAQLLMGEVHHGIEVTSEFI